MPAGPVLMAAMSQPIAVAASGDANSVARNSARRRQPPRRGRCAAGASGGGGARPGGGRQRDVGPLSPGLTASSADMSVETLGNALQARWSLTVRCAQGNRDGMKSIRECLRSEKVDLASIVWTRGRNFPMVRLGERLMCPSCGSRHVTVTFSPPAPSGTAAERPATFRDQRIGDMNFTIEEWDGDRMNRILVGTPDLTVAGAAFEAAVKMTRRRWPAVQVCGSIKSMGPV